MSAALHGVLGPWSLLPDFSLQVREAEGELSISIDVFEEPAAPTPVVENVPLPPESTPGGSPLAALADARAPLPKDAGVLDAANDAAKDAALDGGLDAALDAMDAMDAMNAAGDAADVADALPAEDGPTALADGALAVSSPLDAQADGRAGTEVSPEEPGPDMRGAGRETEGLMGASGQVQAGKQNVFLLLNFDEIRRNAIGADLGPLITAIPQWNDFLAGSKVDPVQHTEWIMLNGPSLANTERDAVIVRYSLDDIWVDAAIERIAKRSPQGGKADAGVAGVKVTLGFGDRAPRAFVRPQPHLVAVVPPDYAREAAKKLKTAGNPKMPKGQVLFFRAVNPHGSLPQVPESLSEIRFRVLRGADEGAEVLGEGDVSSAEAALEAATTLRTLLARSNTLAVRLVTRGVLNGVQVTAEKSRVTLHGDVSREQLEALYGLAAGFLGVNVPPPGGSGAGVPGAPPALGPSGPAARDSRPVPTPAPTPAPKP